MSEEPQRGERPARQRELSPGESREQRATTRHTEEDKEKQRCDRGEQRQQHTQEEQKAVQQTVPPAH